MLSFGSFSAKENAILFVEKYYEILVKRPESAAQVFYEEGSSVKLNDGASEKTASTLASINGLLLSLKYARVVIENISCEESNGLLFVKVAAFAETVDVRKRFTQAFVIAPLIKGYKFVNDMVQYLDPIKEAATVKDEVSSVVQQEKESVAKEHVPKSAQDEVSSSSAAASSVVVEQESGPKLTFSSIVKTAAPTESETAAAVAQPPAVQRPSMPAVQKAKAAAPQNLKSVYVKNLPKSFSKSDVLAMFKKFGRIKEGGVFVKTNPNTGICYGFVDFEDGEAAQRAVDSSPQTRNSDGWKVYTELKRPSSGATGPSSGGATGPSSRGPTSVYVKNLPEDSSASDVRAMFEKFGRIKEGGVSVNTNPDTGFCHGFVEFEDAEAAGKAVQAKQVTLSDGWKVNVNVEFKKPSTGPSSRGGRGKSTANNAGRQSGRTN